MHVHEETPKKIFNRYFREAIAYKKIKPYARFTLLDMITLSISNIISDYFFAIKELVIFKNIIDIPVFRILQFYRTWKGYHFYGNMNSNLKNRFYYPTNFLKKQKTTSKKENKINY